MLRLTGKPRNWFETVLMSVGFPLLLIALVLAAATPSARSISSSIIDVSGQSVVAAEGAVRAPAMGTSHVIIDLSGWELYLYGATGRLLSYGLSPAISMLSVATYLVTVPRIISWSPPALPLHAPYHPQAPPS